METNIFNAKHGKMTVKGTEKFYVPVERFTISPLPAGGTYALMANRVIGGTESAKKIDDIPANDYMTCEVTVGVELYVSGVSSDYEFYICW